MKKGFFITGTDTEVGKTWVTVSLMRYFKMQGQHVLGMKPVAAGCEWIDGQLKNDDALLLQKNASTVLDYEQINPYAFEMPVSPHLAAGDNAVQLEVLIRAFKEIQSQTDVVLVEGAGGWFAPLSDSLEIADLVTVLGLPVIVVVAIRLGCINHAKLTFQAIQQSGVPCAGWIAMCVDSAMEKQAENIATISSKTSIPLLAVMPFSKNQDFDILVSKLIARKLI